MIRHDLGPNTPIAHLHRTALRRGFEQPSSRAGNRVPTSILRNIETISELVELSKNSNELTRRAGFNLRSHDPEQGLEHEAPRLDGWIIKYHQPSFSFPLKSPPEVIGVSRHKVNTEAIGSESATINFGMRLSPFNGSDTTPLSSCACLASHSEWQLLEDHSVRTIA